MPFEFAHSYSYSARREFEELLAAAVAQGNSALKVELIDLFASLGLAYRDGFLTQRHKWEVEHHQNGEAYAIFSTEFRNEVLFALAKVNDLRAPSSTRLLGVTFCTKERKLFLSAEFWNRSYDNFYVWDISS